MLFLPYFQLNVSLFDLQFIAFCFIYILRSVTGFLETGLQLFAVVHFKLFQNHAISLTLRSANK